jgi:anti-sigma regulatory factor (Ser/Thr protein kinase)
MSHPTLWSHEQRLLAEAESIAKARSFVGGLLVEHRIPRLSDDVRLVVSELATNAIRHASTPFTVTLERLAWSVLLTVTDGSQARPVRLPAGLLDTGGRGLSIVECVSREWGVSPARPGTGKSVWASFAVGEARVTTT